MYSTRTVSTCNNHWEHKLRPMKYEYVMCKLVECSVCLFYLFCLSTRSLTAHRSNAIIYCVFFIALRPCDLNTLCLFWSRLNIYEVDISCCRLGGWCVKVSGGGSGLPYMAVSVMLDFRCDDCPVLLLVVISSFFQQVTTLRMRKASNVYVTKE